MESRLFTMANLSFRINTCDDQMDHKMIPISNFWQNEQGQDLIEYTLLLSFVALASAALFIGSGAQVKTIWTTSNNQLANAVTKVS